MMRIGGGRERWMVAASVAILVGVTTMFMGGPDTVLTVLEHMVRDALDLARQFLRR